MIITLQGQVLLSALVSNPSLCNRVATTLGMVTLERSGRALLTQFPFGRSVPRNSERFLGFGDGGRKGRFRELGDWDW